MKLVGPEFYQETEPSIQINYGVIDLSSETLNVTIKDIEGKPIYKRSLNLDRLNFNESRLKHPTMCIALQRDQKLF